MVSTLTLSATKYDGYGLYAKLILAATAWVYLNFSVTISVYLVQGQDQISNHV